MTYIPLIAILVVLVVGAIITLTILFRSIQAGHFSNLESGAYVIFDEDEPVGVPQDQLFRDDTDSATESNAENNTSPEDDSATRTDPPAS